MANRWIVAGLVFCGWLGVAQTAAADAICVSRDRTNFRVEFPLDAPTFAPRWTFAGFPKVTFGYMMGYSAEGPYAGFSTAAVGAELLGPDGGRARIGAMELRLLLDGVDMGVAKVWSDTGLHGFTTPEATPLLQKLAPSAPGDLKMSFRDKHLGELLTYSIPMKEIASGIQGCAPKPG